jgi:hypothetical protein
MLTTFQFPIDDYAEFREQRLLAETRARLINEEAILLDFSKRISAMLAKTREQEHRVDCRFDFIPH